MIKWQISFLFLYWENEIICFVDKARRNGNTFKNVLAMAQATDHKFASNRIYMHTVATS